MVQLGFDNRLSTFRSLVRRSPVLVAAFLLPPARSLHGRMEKARPKRQEVAEPADDGGADEGGGAGAGDEDGPAIDAVELPVLDD